MKPSAERRARAPRAALLQRLQLVANVAGAGALLWLASPLVTLAGRHPFDGVAPRVALLSAVGAAVLAVNSALAWRQRRRQARLVAGLQGAHPPAASDALTRRFQQAMELLRSGVAGGAQRPRGGIGWVRWWPARRGLLQLPWYVFIGAPGAGKTTALLHSGLRFPLAERLGTQPVAGIGGTRQCDWWFTDRAVFLDTAGRYTTQDSRTTADAHEWQTFLRLLRRHRPVQPINGVIVTVSVPDLLAAGAELEHQAQSVDDRLRELRNQLGQGFPVYLLVTKADLLAGFVEFFGDFDAAQREQAWGLTFELPTTPGAPALPPDLHERLGGLVGRIAAMTPARLQAEPLQQRRAPIYHFAAQIESVLPALGEFMRRAFRSTADGPVQPVRGVFLSSGTQEGNPVDRVLGELSRRYGMTLKAATRAPQYGKSFFLSDPIRRLIIPESALAGANLKRQRLRRGTMAMAGATLAAATLALCAGWIASYRSNAAYVEAVQQRVDQVSRHVELSREARVDRLLPVYSLLGQLAQPGAIDPMAAAPLSMDLGLFQGPRLAQSARQTYRRVLDRTLAPWLAERLTRAIRDTSDPMARYEALRIGLMLTTPARMQRAEVRRWAAQAFAPAKQGDAGSRLPGPAEQAEWLGHLDALLERNAVLDVFQLDDASVNAARIALAATPLDQRVHDRLLRRARDTFGGEQMVPELTSPNALWTLAGSDARVPPPRLATVFTQRAWREAIEPAVEPTIAEIAEESEWVLGERSPALQRLLKDHAARNAVARQVALRHAQSVTAQWERLLASVVVAQPRDPGAAMRLAEGLAAPDSALRMLLRRLATELATTGSAAPSSVAGEAFAQRLAEQFGPLATYAASAGASAIDRLIVPLPQVLAQPESPRAVELRRQLRAEAGEAPEPLRAIWTALADVAAAPTRTVPADKAGTEWATLTQACQRLIDGSFPFVPDAKQDMPASRFAQLFGPQGLLDAFFRERLAAQVDTSQRPWRLRSQGPSAEKARSALRAFEMAEDIRRLFFPGGSASAQLRLTLTPVSMDADLLLFSAEVDGQLLRYENGPRRPRILTWPGPAGSQRVVLRILPAVPPGPKDVIAEVHEGPWAWLRVLQKHDIQQASGNAASARLEVGGRSLRVAVQPDGSVSAALLGELRGFRCPEGW